MINMITAFVIITYSVLLKVSSISALLPAAHYFSLLIHPSAIVEPAIHLSVL